MQGWRGLTVWYRELHRSPETEPLLERADGRTQLRYTITYSATSSACEKDGQWRQALEFLEGMWA